MFCEHFLSRKGEKTVTLPIAEEVKSRVAFLASAGKP